MEMCRHDHAAGDIGGTSLTPPRALASCVTCLRVAHPRSAADAVSSAQTLRARRPTAEGRTLLILPEHGQLCGCYAPTEPLYSTRGLVQCNACGAIGMPGSGPQRGESSRVVTTTESGQATDNERSGI